MKKTGTIFDLTDTELPEGQKGYLKLAEKAPSPKDDSFWNTVQDYGKTVLKGSVEGLSRFGRVLGPLDQPHSTEEQLHKQTEALNELLPTDEGYGQKALRRGLREAPTAIALGGSPLSSGIRSMVAGAVGQGVEELGGPEWLQKVSELSVFVGPDIFQKLIASGSKKEIVEAARRFGMTDEEITPLLQSEFKEKWLSKLVPRRGSTESLLKKTKKGLVGAYEYITQSPIAKTKELAQEEATIFNKAINEILFSMPQKVRNKILGDFSDLSNGPLTIENLINFYQDVGHSTTEGAKQLSLLKDPIKKAISSISTEAGKDFEIVNQLWSKYQKVASRLKPNVMTDIIGASKAVGTLFALSFGPMHLAGKVAAPILTGKIAKEMLFNPRFQQFSHKMADAMLQNKFTIGKKLIDLFINDVKKYDKDIANELENISDEQLKELFTQVQKNKQK